MQRITLGNLCGGAVQEKIDRAIQQVSENILDPNTNAKKRGIVLEITFTPNEDDREDVAVDIDLKVKLAQESGMQTQFYLTKDLDTGALSVSEYEKGQLKGQLSFGDIELVNEETGEITNITPFKAKEA